MAAVKALQQWCRVRCEGYRDVSVTNMTTSFRDGLAFCALIHKHRPDLINFDSLRKENVYENNKLAFQVAERELGIPALLDAEDMVALKVPDRLSILTYVSQYYNYFHGRSPIGGMGGIKRPAEGPADEPSGKKNQPVTAKPFPSSSPARENSPPPSPNITRPSPNITRPSPAPAPARTAAQDTVSEKLHQSGTLSNRCVACNQRVHLVQRHLVDGKLYHRNCARLQSPTNATAPLRPLLTNSPVSRFTPPPESSNINTSPSQTPSRLAPAVQTEKLGTTSSFSSTFSSPAPARPAKESPTAFFSRPAAPQTTSGTSVATRPTAAARALTTAEKTHQAKLRFLQPKNTANDQEKKTTTVNMDVNKWPKATGKVPEAKAGPAQTVVANVGVAGRKEASPSGGDKAKAAGVGGNETDKAKASAAAFISKKLAEDTNNNSNKPPWANVALKKTDKPQPQVETPKRETGVEKGRRKLKVNPSILADVQPADKVTSAPARPGPGPGPGPKAPERGAVKTGGATPSVSAAPESESPADWRSKLKPVAKETKQAGASQTPKPRADIGGDPQTSGLSVTPPAPKGLQNGPNNKTANGTKSNVSKAKPDYIPKEDIAKELQEIEDSLNELEKRGVELEVKLRKSEEEGEDDSLMDELMVEWFGLIRNKQVAVRRESELVYIEKTQDLEEQQPSVEQELRRLMEKPDHLKTQWDRKREEQLMKKLMEIVNDRNAILEGLDEDRLREEEEDQQLDKMMMNLNIKKDKAKKKSPIAKLFGCGNKKEGR